MECISILCGGNKEEGYGLISTIITSMENRLGITITKRTGTCLADFTNEEVDEECEEMYEPITLFVSFLYWSQEFELDIERITDKGSRFFEFKIQFKGEDDLAYIQESALYDFKEKLLVLLDEHFGRIFWLLDTQNEKISTDLYKRIHKL